MANRTDAQPLAAHETDQFWPEETSQLDTGLPGVRQPPPPGEESAGPALTQLVTELAVAVEAMRQLSFRAERDLQDRVLENVRAAFQTDGSGHGQVKVYDVPQGFIAHLVRFVIDSPARNPSTAALAAGAFAYLTNAARPANVAAGGTPTGTLEIFPNVAGPGATVLTIPSTYTYAGLPPSPPTLRGGQAFYFILAGVAAIANIDIVVQASFRLIAAEG